VISKVRPQKAAKIIEMAAAEERKSLAPSVWNLMVRASGVHLHIKSSNPGTMTPH
jgi:hypothetical protein